MKVSKHASLKVSLYLCGGLQQRQQLPPPLGVLSHPWQPAGHPEPPTGRADQTLRRVPGQDGAVLMGVGPLANPGHAGRGAGPGAAAAGRNRNRKEREDRRKRDLGDLKALEEVAHQEVINRKKVGRQERELSAAMCTRGEMQYRGAMQLN